MTNPTVALVDPLWIGHHPMYFGEFAASFMRCGADVVGFCPNPEEGEREIRQASQGREPECHLLRTGGRSVLNGRFEGDPWRTRQRWQFAADAIHRWEAEQGRKVDLVYFPYLDSYLRFLPFPKVPEATIGRKWSGLYLRNHHYRNPVGPRQAARLLAKGDNLLRSSLCRGIGVLDERYAQALEDHAGKKVSPFPDVTLTDLPEHPSALSEEIRRKAGGRKIIGLIGAEKRKGVLTLIRLARRAIGRRKDCYFVIAGVTPDNEFSPSEREELDTLRSDIVEGRIDHVHFDPEAPRIPTEPEYNSLFSCFDIAWAAYIDFQGSSGTLSKAAAFETPVIASEGECIGERVERYRLGCTIPQDDEKAAENALAELLTQPGQPDFEGYRQEHSRERLDKRLADLLGSI